MTADIITAITAILALLAAAWAAKTAYDVFKVEQARDDKDREREKRSQADQVFAWAAVTASNETQEVLSQGVVIANTSGVPVFDVLVDSVSYDYDRNSGGARSKTEPRLKLAMVPPGTYYVQREPESKYHWGFPRDVDGLEGAHIVPVSKSKNWVVNSLEFVDATERSWRRSDRGVLEPAS